jgi:hypothetical protein
MPALHPRRIAEQALLENGQSFCADVSAGRKRSQPRFDAFGRGAVGIVPPQIDGFDTEHHGDEQQDAEGIEDRAHVLPPDMLSLISAWAQTS